MKNINRLLHAGLACLTLSCASAQAAPVATAEDTTDSARAPRSATLSGGTSSAGKTITREESKTIDLLIDLQDKPANKGSAGRNESALSDSRVTRSGTGSGTGATPSNAAAAAYFGVPAAAQNRKTSESEGANSDPGAQRQAAAGSSAGAKPQAADSGFSSWLPRDLFRWIRDNRFEFLAAVLGTFALVWLGSAAFVRQRG